MNLKYILFLCAFNLASNAIGQTIKAYKSFHGTEALSTVAVEDDLYLRFDLKKSLNELKQEYKIQTTKLYAVLEMNLGGVEMTTAPIIITEGGAFKSFDLLGSVVLKQLHALALDKKDEWTAKDNFMMAVMAEKSNPMSTWMQLVSLAATEEKTQEVAMKLFLLTKPEMTAKYPTPVAAGNFNLKVKKNALAALYGTKIPMLYQSTPDDGITSDWHKENIGKLLFATKPIEEKATSSAFKKSIDGTENIYAEFYLAKSIRNIAASLGDDAVCTFTVAVSTDEILLVQKQELDKATCQKATKLPLTLQEKDSDAALAKAFHAAIAKLDASKTPNIDVVITFEYTNGKILLAQGSFVLK